jgi:hypothetical protein
MISHKQINRVILILTFVIMICASPYCSAGSDEDRDMSEIKTGDIEVTARGSSPPPYKNGLLLIINKMPDIDIDDPPEWIRNIPNNRDSLVVWKQKYYDSISNDNSRILNYIFDSLGLKTNINRTLVFYNQYMVMEVTTDSLGRYLFIDIPIGYYQIMCTSDFVPESDRKADDCLKNETDDSTVEYFEIPELPEKIQHLGVIDNVRVAADSISVVEVKEYREPMPYEEWPSARDWIAKFKQKGGNNHDRQDTNH